MIFAKFGWNWPCGSGEEVFYISSMYFYYFITIYPCKSVGPFIRTNLNSLYPRMIYAKFGWNWPCGSGEEGFFNFVNVFLLFRNYLPLEKGGALHSINLNPLYPRMLCAKFGWNSPSGSGEKDENVKVYNDDDKGWLQIDQYFIHVALHAFIFRNVINPNLNLVVRIHMVEEIVQAVNSVACNYTW